MKDSDEAGANVTAVDLSTSARYEEPSVEKKSLRQKIRSVVWDSLDRSPEERKFIAKIDFFILTWAGFTYFSKNLNTNNICKFRVAESLVESELPSAQSPGPQDIVLTFYVSQCLRFWDERGVERCRK